MFNAGLATTRVIVEYPTETVDANGAPIRSWTTKRTCFCQVENEQILASESNQIPYEASTRTFTLIMRNSEAVQVVTNDRVREASGTWIGQITGIRYTPKKDVMYIDITTGASNG